MSVIEIITLRGTTNLTEEFCETLLQQIHEQKHQGIQLEIRAYRQNDIGTDLSFHLHWVSDMNRAQKSVIGIIFANYLKDMGIVSHTVWLETSPHLEDRFIRAK